MTGRKAVKPDPDQWLLLLDEYELTSLPHDTVMRGWLRPELTRDSVEVRDMVSRWPGPVYFVDGERRTEVVVVNQVTEGPRTWLGVHVLLLVATLVTTLGSGAMLYGVDPFDTQMLRIFGMDLPYPTALHVSRLWIGATFALSFLGVLLCHEMGHYLAARVHRVRVSLPYFIPFPPYLSVIGTLGAFIRLRGPTIRRSVMFDIGSAGPFASFLVALPMFIIGLGLSEPVPGASSVTSPFLIYFFGQPVWLGSGVLTWALAELFGPIAFGERMILLHPLALSGWLGLFVTTLNLLPLGQLDGGHVVYALAPARQARVARLFLLGLAPLGLLWWGWWGWALLILLVHRGRLAHPRVVQPDPDPGTARDLLGLILIAIFLLTFVPVPIGL